MTRICQACFGILLFMFINLQYGIGQSLPIVVINEINYRSEFEDENIEFVELYNRSGITQNLSNWTLDGGIKFTFPVGTTLNNGAYLVIGQDPLDVQSRFGITNVIGPWVGKLKNKGEDVLLYDNDLELVDKVDYKGWQEWPSTDFEESSKTETEFCSFPYGGGSGNYAFSETYKVAKSLQKLHPDLPGRHAGSWTARNPTPKGLNTGSITQANIPVINRVSKKPDQPTPGVPVTIEAEIENIENVNGTVTVKLEYQVVSPGDFINKDDPRYNTQWTVRDMSDNGMPPDSNALNGVYTYNIPGSANQHRQLIRYRINVISSLGYNRYFPDQNHNESNYAYYVYDTYPAYEGIEISALNTIPNIQLITTSLDIASYVTSDIGFPSATDNEDYLGQGALVYNGKVYDHIGFRARGKGTRHSRLKRNLKFDMNGSRSFVPVNDCGKEYDTDRGKFSLSGGWVNDANSHGLTESLIYKIAELSGAFNKYADYHHLRIVQNANQNHGSLGDFWGIYLALEDWGGDMLSEHDLPDGNIYSYKPPTDFTQPPTLSHRGDLGPYDACSNEYEYWNQIIGDSRDGFSAEILPAISLTNLLNNLDLEHYYADWTMNEICGNGETNYTGQHSYREYYNPVTQKWTIQCGDYDEMFGMPHGNNAVTPRSMSTRTLIIDHPLKDQVSTHSSLIIEAANKNRHVLDLLFGANDASEAGNNYPSKIEDVEQLNHLLNGETEKIYAPNASSWVNADYLRWSGSSLGGDQMSYSDYGNDVVDWYKDWFSDRADYLLNNAGSPFSSEEDKIPNRPSISYIGPAGFPIDNLNFSNSSFTDPNGNNTFAAFEWRVGEYSDPNNPVYDTKCRPRYEIESVWSSGEIGNQLNSFPIDGTELKPGRTYKVRLRYKDNTGRWGHWSDPISFVAGNPINPIQYDIVISEIHYHATNPCDDFVEIYNNGSGVLIEDLEFSEGVKYQFLPGTFLNAGEYFVLAEDSLCFIDQYGFSPDAQYSGKLDNGGEELIITTFTEIVDSVKFNDKIPWDTIPDDGIFSLALINPNLDNSSAVNWSHQCVFETAGAANNFTSGCTGLLTDLSDLVINEISYRPTNQLEEFIEIKNTGTATLQVMGTKLQTAVTGSITESTLVPPGGFFVFARDSTAFHNKFGVAPSGVYQDNLSDSGENVVLQDFFGALIDQVQYDNQAPWNTTAFAGAHSLALIDANFSNSTFVNWSTQRPGFNFTPFAENQFGPDVYPDYTGIVINEIHYAPSNGSSYEFLEIKNTSNTGIYLSDVYFSNGISFTFAQTDYIGPNQFIVLANNQSSFLSEYGIVPDGDYSGFLSNFGETIRMRDLFGNIIDEVSYNDIAPWDPTPANGLYSLALKIGANNDLASSWSAQNVNFTIKSQNTFIPSCPQIIVETANQSIQPGLRQAQNYILTNSVLYSGSSTYQAGNYIEMASSFEIKLGSTFEALIGNCQ